MEEKNKLITQYIYDNAQMIINKYGNIITNEQIKKAIDKFSNSQEDIQIIRQQIDLGIERIIKRYLSIMQNNERHYELNNMFDCRITNDTLHIHVVSKSLQEDIQKMGLKKFIDFMDVKLQDALTHIPIILNYSENENIKNIFASITIITY